MNHHLAALLLLLLQAVAVPPPQKHQAPPSAFKLLDARLAQTVGFYPAASHEVHVFHLETPQEREAVVARCLSTLTHHVMPTSGDGLGALLGYPMFWLLRACGLVRADDYWSTSCQLTNLPVMRGCWDFRFVAWEARTLQSGGGIVWLSMKGNPSRKDVVDAVQKLEDAHVRVVAQL